MIPTLIVLPGYFGATGGIRGLVREVAAATVISFFFFEHRLSETVEGLSEKKANAAHYTLIGIRSRPAWAGSAGGIAAQAGRFVIKKVRERFFRQALKGMALGTVSF